MDRHLLESEDILEEILAAADCMEDVRDGFLDMLFQNLQMPVVEKGGHAGIPGHFERIYKETHCRRNFPYRSLPDLWSVPALF